MGGEDISPLCNLKINLGQFQQPTPPFMGGKGDRLIYDYGEAQIRNIISR